MVLILTFFLDKKSKQKNQAKKNLPGARADASRFYEFDEEKKTISIGYTFISRDCWGKNYNRALKLLMINHAFKFVDKIVFHIGASNIRSQKAIEKLGANKAGEVEMEYYGEPKRLNIIYSISKKEWTENLITKI